MEKVVYFSYTHQGVNMSGRVPGSICSTRVGADWIDNGTLCLAKSPAPGPLGAVNPAKAGFDSAHVYSLAKEAGRKRAIDLEILGKDYARSGEIRLDNAAYLKQLIDIASNGRRKVQTAATGLQFYVVKGGAEGLLPEAYRNSDANLHTTPWVDTNGVPGSTDFDENDLLVVFATDGSLVGAARLRRATRVARHMSQETATAIFAAWDRKPVLIYRNTNPRPGWIPYLGLGVSDGFREQNKVVDIHKVEATNGCYFIDDPTQFLPGAPDVRTFEPVLIKKVIAAKGLAEADITGKSVTLGTMNIVDVSPF